MNREELVKAIVNALYEKNHIRTDLPLHMDKDKQKFFITKLVEEILPCDACKEAIRKSFHDLRMNLQGDMSVESGGKEAD